METVQVRFCPTGVPTEDAQREFRRIPCRGESIIHYGKHFVVVEVDWDEDGEPFLIAHAADRPRARALLSPSEVSRAS
jgi:hypothetical protein